jgi:hypothetical protein
MSLQHACFVKVFATDLMHQIVRRNGTSFDSAKHFCLDNNPIVLKNDDKMTEASNVQVAIVWLHKMTLCLQGFFPTVFQPSNQDVSPGDSTEVKRLTTADAFKKKVLTSAVRTYPQIVQCRGLLSDLFLTEKYVFKTYFL